MMRSIARHNWKRIFGLVLFLVGQLFSVAHASEFGVEHHEHDGVDCLALLGDEQDRFIPAASLGTLTPSPNSVAVFQLADQTLRLQRQSIRPPATGPPSI